MEMLLPETMIVMMLVLMYPLAIVAGIFVLMIFARRPSLAGATPSPVPSRRPAKGSLVYRSLTPSSLPHMPERKPLPIYQRKTTPAAMPVVRAGPLREAHFPLARLMIALGRASRCDITLPDAQASRQHAQLEWRWDGLCVVDTHSTHGTYVNGLRISQARL